MDDIHGICRRCQARVTRPMPQAWICPEGDPEVDIAQQLLLMARGCPHCGSDQVRRTRPAPPKD